VARAYGVAPAPLASEAALALGGLRADTANLVVACRRIVERHPDVGQLWWLCARLLVADDPSLLAWELADRLGDDAVADVLTRELPVDATVVSIGNPTVVADALVRRDDVRVCCVDGRFGAADLVRRLDRNDIECEPVAAEAVGRAIAAADAVLIEASAASARRVLAPIGSQVVAAVAQSVGTPVWLVAATGTRLPAPYVDEIARRSLGDHCALDDVPLELIDVVVSDLGKSPRSPGALRADCPFAPELLRPGVT